ncbi:MAG: hypothetical protein LBN95_07575 [Prevotellaceae bacterium]|jgi:hypothetical protein|nr:hypothetical protein [Prevotellaceae bacterium]
MKKTSLISILLVLFCLVGNAQKLKVTNNQPLKDLGFKEKENQYIGFDGNSHYFIINNNVLLKTDKALKKSTIFQLNKNIQSQIILNGVLKNRALLMSVKTKLINFSSEEAFGFISFENNNKENTLTLKKNSVKNNSLSEKILQTIKHDKDDYIKTDVAVSGDKSKKLVAFSFIEKKINLNSYEIIYKHTTFFVIDADGEIIWNKTISSDFNEINVCNDGSVVIISYETNENKCNLHLQKFDEEGKNDITEVFPFKRICEIQFLELSNGNVFIGGYYSTGAYNYGNAATDDLGTFCYVFDKNLEKLNFKSKTLEQTKPKDFTLKEAYSKDTKKLIRGIYETTDGKITMLAEEEYSGIKNILINSFDLNGNYENFSILFKKQGTGYEGSSALFSFFVLKNNDELILIYNDDIGNDITQNVPNPKTFNRNQYKKTGQTIACTIKNGLVGKKQVLINATTEGRIMNYMIEQFDNEALIRVETEKAGLGQLMIEKIILE